MKFVLDLDKLFEEGRITQEECTRLKAYALKDTGTLAFNILVGFGIVTTAVGLLSYFPSPWTAILLGTFLGLVGYCLHRQRSTDWGLLGSMTMLVGALTVVGGMLALTEGNGFGFIAVTALCACVAYFARSVLFSILGTLSLSASIGALMAYEHASYFLAIRQPAVSIVVFSVLAFVSFWLSKKCKVDYERILIACSRTSVFIVNLGFWIGSLWGDSLWKQQDSWDFRRGAVISDTVFVVGWAIALIVTAIWAARTNRRWLLNLLMVFGALHFYTQYFERLGANPPTLISAGIIALLISWLVVLMNRSLVSVPEELGRSFRQDET